MRGFIKRLQHLILAVRYWPAKRKMKRQIIVKLESAPVNEYMDFLLGKHK
jgi:hypothetical protein